MKLFKHYGFFGVLRLLVDLLLTKIFYVKARLIRRPFEIRGKKSIFLNDGFTTGRYCRIEAHDTTNTGRRDIISFGRNCQINDSVHIAAAESVHIGNDVLIASRVFITDLNHGGYGGSLNSDPLSICRNRELTTSPVVIADNVWLGEGVVVLPGVNIGRCSIIGANAVVSRDIPEFSIAVGNPARVIKIYDFEKEIWVFVDERP
jgi:acetyltransferase-like isoleucine patch superfamily enzyme